MVPLRKHCFLFFDSRINDEKLTRKQTYDYEVAFP